MPSIPRLLRLVTLPETRHLVGAAYRSATLRDLVRRNLSDPAGLLRRLSGATTVQLFREAIAHPAARELANLGLLMLPGRYLPAGWAASWLLRRLVRLPGRAASRRDRASQPPPPWSTRAGTVIRGPG